MAAKKALSLIHLTRGMSLISRLEEPDSQLELVAVYLMTASTLVKARKSPEVMDEFIAQASELTAEEAAEVLVDFLEQFGKYSGTLAACGLKATAPTPELATSTQTPENA